MTTPTPPSDLIAEMARAISVPEHHTTWDLLSEVQKDLYFMQAQAAYAVVRERIEWQPIASAPKDQWILVFIEAEDEHAGRVHAARNRKIANGFSWVVGHHFASDLAGKPTHWMPQPDPPSNKGLIHDDD